MCLRHRICSLCTLKSQFSHHLDLSRKTPKPKYSIAILQRQRDLERDPLASILSPHLVTCKRCGATVKLHSVSPYDTSHWRTHRSRCLKRPLGSGPPLKVIRKPVQTKINSGPEDEEVNQTFLFHSWYSAVAKEIARSLLMDRIWRDCVRAVRPD